MIHSPPFGIQWINKIVTNRKYLEPNSMISGNGMILLMVSLELINSTEKRINIFSSSMLSIRQITKSKIYQRKVKFLLQNISFISVYTVTTNKVSSFNAFSLLNLIFIINTLWAYCVRFLTIGEVQMERGETFVIMVFMVAMIESSAVGITIQYTF